MPIPRALADAIEAQGPDLDALMDREARRAARLLRDALDDLLRLIAEVEATGPPGDEATPWTAQQRRALAIQTGEALDRLAARLGETMAGAVDDAARLSLSHIAETYQAVGRIDPALAAVLTPVQTTTLRALSESGALQIHRLALSDYDGDLRDDLQRALGRATAAGGRTDDFRAGVRSVLDGTPLAARSTTIARTEVATIYGRAHRDAVAETSRRIDDPDDPDSLSLRVVETRDGRNHPLSRAAIGHIRTPDEPIRIPRAGVVAQAVAMGWGPGRIARWLDRGVLWPLVDGEYRGQHYPGHYNDRGREVPHRRRWARAG